MIMNLIKNINLYQSIYYINCKNGPNQINLRRKVICILYLSKIIFN